MMKKFVILLIVSVLLSMQATSYAAKKTPAKRTAQRVSSRLTINYAGLAKKVLPSIVRIITDKYSGSGFFFSSQGDILTNYHIIEDAESITVSYGKNDTVYAYVKAVDIDGDIALLSIKTSKAVPFLKISKNLPEQGEEIMAVGNPKGLEGTISNGIVSAFRDNNKWIQFTAPVSEGSSGGALINSAGEVVGMPTLLFREGQNLNFAISASVLASFLHTARDNNTAIPNIKAQTSMTDEDWDKLWNGNNSFKSNSDSDYDLWTIYNDFPMY